MAVRMGQIGTKHGHARGKWQALRANPDVEAVGIWEPDAERRTVERARAAFTGAHWYASADELLSDPTVVAVAVEGQNAESLAMAQAAAEAGKHLWYDKPAGDDWPDYQHFIATIRERGLCLQMGYMFRYQPGFQLISDLAKAGALGEIFSLRAHMSTWISVEARKVISQHRGGIFYDLAGHMLDQVVWLLGRPQRVHLIARNDATPELPHFADNTLGVFEFDRALAQVEIAAMETRPLARRFEIYGTRGSMITEPFDPGETVRLVLDTPHGQYAAGEHVIQLPTVTREQMYARELTAFLAMLRGVQAPDRPLEHDRLVQETLLRATGGLPG
jgi:predicted dehydrogenase